MDDIPLTFAKDHLEDLIARARLGEMVTINDGQGPVQLTAARLIDVTAPRVTDTMPPVVPLKEKRTAGRLAGRIPPPPDGSVNALAEGALVKTT